MDRRLFFSASSAPLLTASFSHTTYGLRKAVRDIRRPGKYTLLVGGQYAIA
jgi:hypothetical protein